MCAFFQKKIQSFIFCVKMKRLIFMDFLFLHSKKSTFSNVNSFFWTWTIFFQVALRGYFFFIWWSWLWLLNSILLSLSFHDVNLKLFFSSTIICLIFFSFGKQNHNFSVKKLNVKVGKPVFLLYANKNSLLSLFFHSKYNTKCDNNDSFYALIYFSWCYKGLGLNQLSLDSPPKSIPKPNPSRIFIRPLSGLLNFLRNLNFSRCGGGGCSKQSKVVETSKYFIALSSTRHGRSRSICSRRKGCHKPRI